MLLVETSASLRHVKQKVPTAKLAIYILVTYVDGNSKNLTIDQAIMQRFLVSTRKRVITLRRQRYGLREVK